MEPKQTYIIVSRTSPSALMAAVNDQMKEGYAPVGGIAVHLCGPELNTTMYTQAMLLD